MWDAALIALERFANPLSSGHAHGRRIGRHGHRYSARPRRHRVRSHPAAVHLYDRRAHGDDPAGRIARGGPHFGYHHLGADRHSGLRGGRRDDSRWSSAGQAGRGRQSLERRLFVVDDRRPHRRAFFDSLSSHRAAFGSALRLSRIVDALRSRSLLCRLSDRRRAAQRRSCGLPRTLAGKRRLCSRRRRRSLYLRSALPVGRHSPWLESHWESSASRRSSTYWPRAARSPSE